MRNYLFFLFFGLLSLVFGCKSDKNVDEISASAENVDESQSGTPLSKLIDPCSLISGEQLGQIFNVDPQLIGIKNDQYSGDFSRSCNIKWNNPDDGATLSMLIILQSNPIPGEIDDWADAYLNSRLQTGEKTFPDNGKPIKYIRFEGIDSISAYNEESNKLYWKINKDFVMAVFMSDSFYSGQTKKYLSDLYIVLTKSANAKLK